MYVTKHHLLGLLTSEPEYEDKAEQLRISIDFLLELSQAADSSVRLYCLSSFLVICTLT